RIACFFAIAIGAVFDALERRGDLGNELALAITGTQFKRAVALRAGPVGHSWMVLALFRQGLESQAAFAPALLLPGKQLIPEILPLTRVHERLVLTGPIVRNVDRRHAQTQLQHPLWGLYMRGESQGQAHKLRLVNAEKHLRDARSDA